MIRFIWKLRWVSFILIRGILACTLFRLALLQKSKAKGVDFIFQNEQNKSFECGFDQFSKVYLGFCVQYIKTAFLFLLVDLEIALVVPLFVRTPLQEKVYLGRLLMMGLVFIILIFILIIEVLIGGIDWSEDL